MSEVSKRIAKLSPEKLDRLLQQVGNKEGTSSVDIIHPQSRDGRSFPLSFAQQRLWFLGQLDPNTSTYNESTAISITGLLNQMALELSLNEIVRRHEVLRTTFAMLDGVPVQVIAEQLDVPVKIIDLRELPALEREVRAQQLTQAEAETPFDLATGPLLRVILLQLDATDQIVLFTLHHIVSDGWSIGVLINEVAALYRAYIKNQPSSLPELPIQYADFASWQRQWLSGDVLQRQLDYWTKQLSGSPTLLALPTDHPRPATQSHRGARLSFEIAEQTTAGLYALNKHSQTTLFMTLLAAFNVLLARYSGQNDICIGSPIANRNRAEIEGLIGFFVNTLVLRTQIDSAASFKSLLEQVRASMLNAYAYQDVPFEQLVNVLKPERHTGHSPLFQVMLVLQNAPMDNLELPGLTMQVVASESATARFDLTLNVTEGGKRLFASLEYNTDLFDPATIERMAGHFTRLLDAIVANPNARIQDLPMLGEDERQQILVEWNATEAAYPQDKCIHELFEEQAEKTPEAVAVVFEDQQLTYAELNARANQLAHYLRSQGVGPEVLVGICVERSLEMIIGLLGILKAGGAYVPLDPTYPQDRLAYMLADARVSVLLTQERLLESLPAYSAQVVCLDRDWEALVAFQLAANPVTNISPDNLAYMIYTSGSTGTPKGVMVAHSNVVNYLLWSHQSYYQVPGSGSPIVHSISFDGIVTTLYGPLIAGQTLNLLRTAREIEALSTNNNNLAYTLVKVTPSHLRLWNSALDQYAPSLTQALMVGGEALIPSDIAFWQQRFSSARLINHFGPTETTVGCSTFEIIDDVADLVSIPIGRPIANTQIYLLDSNLNPVPVGVPGALHIAGDGLARGYLNRPELTAEKFIPNPFSSVPGARMYRSGDLARYLPDGNIEYLGRIDHQVKIRGFRIELGEIEAALAAMPDIQDVIVLAREDVPGDKRLVAYLVMRTEHDLPEATELRSRLAQSLPEYMVPSVFVIMEALPLTPNGKIDRNALPIPDQKRPDLEKAFVAPRMPVEEVIADIWIQILNIEKVGVHDNFFELGGHSLLATQVVTQVRKALRVELPVRCLFECPTVASLASLLIEQEESPGQMMAVASLRKKLKGMSPDEIHILLQETKK